MRSQPSRAAIRGFLRAAAEVDLDRARPWSGVRRAVVVLVVIAGVATWLGPATATSAGVAALFIGVMDRQKSPRLTVRVMTVGTVAMAATHLVADSLAPWPLTVMGILVAIAFAEGASVMMHPDAPQVLHYCGTIAATAIVTDPEPGSALTNTIAVLLAGTAQTVATAVAWRVSPRVREDDAVAAQLRLVAESLNALARGKNLYEPDRDTAMLMHRAARAMTATGRLVARSDLATYRVELLTVVLWAAEQARLAGRVVSVTGSMGPREPATEAADRRALAGTARTLELGAATLTRHGAARQMAAESLLSTGTDGWFAQAHLRPVLADFQASVIQLALESPDRVAPDRTGLAVQRQRARVALKPGSLPFRFGVRIAIASSVSMAVAMALGLVRASWAGNSALSIFRPDTGGTLARIILRAAGASMAAVVVVILASTENRAWMLVCMAVAVFLAYSLGPTNYGLFGFFMSLSILMILSAMGSDPLVMAIGRWLDTLIGCAVCVVVAFLFPIWRIESLPATLAATCRGLASWLDGVAGQLREAPEGRWLPGVRLLGERTRDQITDTAATFRLARVEPAGSVPVARLSLVFANVVDAARTTLAVEHLLRGDEPADPAAADVAQQAARVFGDSAAVVASEPFHQSGEPAPEPGTDASPNSAAAQALQRVLGQAMQALKHAIEAAPGR